MEGVDEECYDPFVAHRGPDVYAVLLVVSGQFWLNPLEDCGYAE